MDLTVSIWRTRGRRALWAEATHRRLHRADGTWRWTLKDGEVWIGVSLKRGQARTWWEELSDGEGKDIIQAAVDGSCAKGISNKFRKDSLSQTMDVTKCWAEKFRFHLIRYRKPIQSHEWSSHMMKVAIEIFSRQQPSQWTRKESGDFFLKVSQREKLLRSSVRVPALWYERGVDTFKKLWRNRIKN